MSGEAAAKGESGVPEALRSGFATVLDARLECAWHGPGPAVAPTLVFLHEGLGSVGLWREFPQKLAARTGLGALVYSRAGYGASDPVVLPRPVTYMHDEALRILPALLQAAGIERHILVGHSDGASIALIHAGGAARSGLLGLILEAPHVFTEEMGLRSIVAAGEAYRAGDLRAKLARWHGANVDNAFLGWHDVWTSPAFRSWNIEEYLPHLRVPALAIQGEGDEYGTLRQIEAIERQAGAGIERQILPGCGHSPHRDQEDEVLRRMADFVRRL